MNQRTRITFVRLAVASLLIASVLGAPNTDKLGKKCVNDDGCSAPFIVCQEKKCQHKKLFPMNGSEVLALILLLCIQMVSTVVSIAGGSIIVPISVFLMGFSAQQAVAMSNSITIMTSLVKYLMSLFHKDPKVPFKTITNYNAAIVMTPCIVTLSTLGAILGALLPALLISILLTGALIYSITAGVSNLKRQLRIEENRKKEEQRRMAELQPAQTIAIEPEKKSLREETNNNILDSPTKTIPETPESSRPLTMVTKESSETVGQPPIQTQVVAIKAAPVRRGSINLPETPEIAAQKRIEGNPFYMKKFVVLIITFVLAILVAIFRGSKGFPSVIGVDKCSGADWAILVVYLVLMSGIPFYSRYIVFKEQEHKKSIGWDLGEREVIFKPKGFYTLCAFSAGTGLISTLIGIGGGIIFGPVMGRLGFTPMVASWTINLSIFMGKVAAVVINYMAGDILLGYVLLFGGVISVGIIISENTIMVYVKKFKSQVFYPIAFLIIVCLSIALVVFVAIDKAVSDNKKGVSLWQFKNYC